MHQDFDLDWEEVLQVVDIYPPEGRTEFSICCPLHKDRVASCSINIDKGVWICFAGCGQGSIASLVMKLKGWTVNEFNQQFEKSEATFNLDFMDDLFPAIAESDEDVLPEMSLPEDFIPGKLPYWIYNRGFDHDFLITWECGTNKFNDLIIPIRDKYSRLIGWVARRMNAIPKYWYSPGLKKSKVLFGEHKLTPANFVCVTEGTLDALWLIQNGFQAVAILGATVSYSQSESLRKLRTQELVMCLDSDNAGVEGVKKLASRVENSFILSRINFNKGVKDVQDIRNKDDLTNTLKNRYYW